MNETAEDAWFYTKEGERCGPVTFTELRVKAAEGGLNPRLDLVWTKGMADWKPSGEVEGLFEKKAAVEPPPSLAPAADPYSPPEWDSTEEIMGRDNTWPGARRRGYLFFAVIFPFLWSFGIELGLPFLTKSVGADILPLITMAANIVPLIIGLWITLQRFTNLGMSRWWLLGNLVPFLNLWVGYRLFACPAGYAYHKKLDGMGIFLAIIYWLLVLALIAFMIFVIAILAGAAGGPEIQEKLRELMQEIEASRSSAQ